MCIFCGGTCGGAGDAVIPVATLGISLAVWKIQAVKTSRKQKNSERQQ